jgi:hypothetical protein
MTHMHAAVLRAAIRLQHFYRYLAPGAQRMIGAAHFHATAYRKRSFVG